MSYKYQFKDSVYLLNFSEEFPKNPLELVSSDAFEELISQFFKFCKKKHVEVYEYLIERSNNDENLLIRRITKLTKLLLVLNAKEVTEAYPHFVPYFDDKDMLYKLTENIYLFWRRHERYCVVSNRHDLHSLEDISFLEAQAKFKDLILEVYRRIEETLGFNNLVYRQIIAGVNAGLVLNTNGTNLPDEYNTLEEIPMITQINIQPPFITRSKSYKRAGLFNEIQNNPISNKSFNRDEWFCYPAKVGDLLIYVYFNIGFMGQGVALCNLFEMADMNQVAYRKPDLIYVCGYDDDQNNQCFYQDEDNNIMIGYLSLSDDHDYFGYMKKMILTLHNVQKINNGGLPIHGAMVEILFKNKIKKRLVIMGDSGAGKSETIEQIKTIADDEIDSIKVIYDDMGVLYYDDNQNIVSSGTEVGAFVRLNDLEAGYGYKELDRSVIMNPDQPNARIVTPTALWKEVVAKYPIDYFLYANNYEDSNDIIKFFNNKNDALEVFKQGKRMSKNTTNEAGITKSFFANPFGPVQRQEQTNKLLDTYFEDLFKQGVKVGQIYTKLGIKGKEKSGPKNAAEKLLEIMHDDK